jgi:hypothetical protein
MIQPKYEIGDTVYYLSGDLIYEGVIYGRKVEDYEKETGPKEYEIVEQIFYRIDKTVHAYRNENHYFSTIVELIEDLENTVKFLKDK